MKSSAMLDTFLKKNWVPDFLIRLGIRHFLGERLHQEFCASEEIRRQKMQNLIAQMNAAAIALNTTEANQQHYEVPTEFYQLVLGSHLKYSSAFWPEKTRTLDDAETAMLQLSSQRAELKNGQSILELGCGWGSLTLWMAQHFPDSAITAVSNSATQKTYIETTARQRGIGNVKIITQDMNTFSATEKFDRIVSVEMFEHMRNYAHLLERARSWIKDDGKLFIHIFTHKKYTYFFEDRDPNDWMSRYFFTGGLMPADDLLYQFQTHFTVQEHWQINGTHYGRTARCWLENMDKNQKKIQEIFKKTYGEENALSWQVYWRIFFMACEELWNYDQGKEWLVSHYLLSPKPQG